MKKTVITIVNVDLIVEYEYYYHPAVWTLPNGDPGYPEQEECNILNVTIGNVDITNLVYDIMEFHAAIYDRICNYEQILRLHE